MFESVRNVIEEHRGFYEVTPYYVWRQERTHGVNRAMRKIQAGFDIDLYGIKADINPEPPPDYALAYGSLREVVDRILAHASDFCSIEVIPLGSRVILDTRNHLRPLGTLRIRITHERGLDEPAGPPEERALKEVEEQLLALGLKEGRG